uniref:Uncharacterized protein n=1 Tax=Arundo donax TaxID=35708 RepID=A0A0A9FQ21_ARUDO
METITFEQYKLLKPGIWMRVYIPGNETASAN